MYRLYTVVPRLVRFIDQLTNWYVRFNRKRIKVGQTHMHTSTLPQRPPLPYPSPPPLPTFTPSQGEQGREECLQSLQALFSVVYLMTRMMAPFTPFFTEHIFQVSKDNPSFSSSSSSSPSPSSSPFLLLMYDFGRNYSRTSGTCCHGNSVRRMPVSITSCCPSRGVCRVLYALCSTEYREFTGLTCFVVGVT